MKHRKQILKLIVDQGIIGISEFTDFVDETNNSLGNLDSQIYELEELVKQTEYREKDRSREIYLMAATILEQIYTEGGTWTRGKYLSGDMLELEFLVDKKDFATASSFLLELINTYGPWLILKETDFEF